jgi:hypothetical protein
MTVPFYPLLLAVYPILALLASNIDQVHAGAALRPALLSAASVLLLMGALRLRLRDWHRAAALAGLASLAFFTYGHVCDVLSAARSPINNFRLVLRAYFGIDLPDLDDSSFYSTYDAPFDFLPIEQSCAFDGSAPPAGDPLDGSPTELYTGATTE